MDAKSLLRAKKAAARIEHPYATYTAAGVLRCSICAVPVKQWDAHLLTKQHRQSVAREKEIAAKLEKERAKKRAMEEASAPSAKRARVEEDNDDDDGPKLPPGFFSDGKGPAVEDDEEESPRPVAEPAPPATGDAELDSFLASLDDDEPAPAPTAAKKKAGYKLSAEEGVASYAAAPIMLNDAKKEQEAEPEVRETEAEKRARLAREEKEEVMARLEEEERAQEDADSRVTALKARMEALKKKREAAKAKSAKVTK